MARLSEKIDKSPFKSVSAVARHLDLNHSHLFNFIAKRYSKIGREKRRKILLFFRSQGWLPTPKPRPRHGCPDCGKIHAIGSNKNEGPLVAHVRDLVDRIIAMNEEINHSSDPKLKMHLDDLVQELVKAMIEKESVQAQHTQNAERDVESPVHTSERTE